MKGAARRDLGRLLVYAGLGLLLFFSIAAALTSGVPASLLSRAGPFVDGAGGMAIMAEPAADAPMAVSFAAFGGDIPAEPPYPAEIAVLAISFAFLFVFNISLALHVGRVYAKRAMT